MNYFHKLFWLPLAVEPFLAKVSLLEWLFPLMFSSKSGFMDDSKIQ